MIMRYRLLAGRLRAELETLKQVVRRAEEALSRADYLEFRHVVRNLYTFNLRPDRVAELVRGLRPAFDLARKDLLDCAEFLEELSTAGEGEGKPS